MSHTNQALMLNPAACFYLLAAPGLLEPFVADGRSKTANILFAVAFDERHRKNGIRPAAVHPRAIQTELARHTQRLGGQDLTVEIRRRRQTCVCLKSLTKRK